jgi:nucleoside-diphosphate-sugar epimerase
LNRRAEKATVLLTGASSQLGVFLIPRLIDSGLRVIALSRRAAVRPADLDENPLWIHPDALLLAGDDSPLITPKEIEFLVSCGPLNVAIKLLQYCSGIRRVIVFSTSSVFSKAESPDREENETIRSMLRWESQLKSLCKERDLALMILRPTLIYGCGMDRNISLLAAWIKRFGWLPLAIPARGLRQPVHADDLAWVAVEALNRKQPLMLDTAACGGSTLSYTQMVERVFGAVGKPRRIIRIPARVLAMTLGMLTWIPAFRGVNSEMVRRQNIDLVFDDSQLRQELNYNPRPFKPNASDFRKPTSALQYQPAGQADGGSEKLH